jgi:hypothetical protein
MSENWNVESEAAHLWKEGWSPACRGGALLMLAPNRRNFYSMSEAYKDPAFGEAVWARLVVVYESLSLGNRQGRRRTEARKRRMA